MNNLCRSTKTSNTPHNFSWLIPDKLAGCAVPSDSRDIDGLVDLGVTKLITLSEEKLPAQMNLGASVSGLKHEIHGCVEFEGIPVDKIVKIIDSIESLQSQGVAGDIFVLQAKVASLESKVAAIEGNDPNTNNQINDEINTLEFRIS